MKPFLIIVVLSVCLAGCKSGTDDNNSVSDNKAPNSAVTKAPEQDAGGVAPMTSGAGGITPVTGTDSVEGAGGGGVGQAAKKMAKDKTANMGGGSLNQGDKDDSGQ